MTHTDHLEPNEVEIRDLLERTMSGAPVPVALGPRALQDGRRLRARRRAGTAAGLVAATAVAAILLPTALGGGSPRAIGPADETSSSAPTPSPSMPPSIQPEPGPTGWWDMPASDMISAVEAIAPDGVDVTPSGPLKADTPAGGPATGHVEVLLEGPTGVGQLSLDLSPSPLLGNAGEISLTNCTVCEETFTLPSSGHFTCPPNLPSRVQCAELREEDGTLIGHRTEITGDVTRLEVVLRRDGGTIHAEVSSLFTVRCGDCHSDDTQESPVPPPKDNALPLTLDQLEDLVRNDTWVRPAT